MHPSILEAGPVVLAAALAAALPAALPSTARAAPPPSHPTAARAALPPARSACPAPQATVQEVFITADCADCWAATGSSPAAAAAAGWRFDWITPTIDTAPLAPAALPEAAERAQRAGVLLPAGGQQRAGRPAVARLPGLVLAVASGPAWQGYFGVELTLQRGVPVSLPAGSSAWLALVERVPAGGEGSTIARELVRTVAGPLPLPLPAPPAAPGAAAQASARAPLTHLRALRWPETAQPARLQARAWIEGPDGRILAVAADRCP